jgi:hypothetical protein
MRYTLVALRCYNSAGASGGGAGGLAPWKKSGPPSQGAGNIYFWCNVILIGPPTYTLAPSHIFLAPALCYNIMKSSVVCQRVADLWVQFNDSNKSLIENSQAM